MKIRNHSWQIQLSASMLLLALSGCGIYETKGTNSLPQNAAKLLSEPVSYARVNQYVFSQSCTGCHSSAKPTAGVALDSFQSVKANLGEIQAEAMDTSDMPPAPSSLSAFQKQLLSQWIAAGAPEQPVAVPTQPDGSVTPTPTGAPTGPTPSPTPNAAEAQAMTAIRGNFDLFVKPLVKRACMDCHDSTAKLTGINKLPVLKGIESKHIIDASHALDFSQTFPNWSAQSADPLYYLVQLQGVLVNKTMPLEDYKIFHALDGTLLSKDDTQIILNWIEDSTQKLAAVATSRPTAQQFLSNHCLECHNTTINFGGFILGQGGKTSNGIPFITPSDPKNSAIYLVLLQDANSRHGLKEMPSGGSASVDDQNLVFDWIQGGAQ